MCIYFLITLTFSLDCTIANSFVYELKPSFLKLTKEWFKNKPYIKEFNIILVLNSKLAIFNVAHKMFKNTNLNY